MKSRYILIADDDEDYMELLDEALRSINPPCKWSIFPDGEALINYLNFASEAPALIISDLKMPKSSGIDVLLHVKNASSFSSVPVVMLSTSDLEKDIENSYKHGCVDYKTKPVRYEKLIELLQELIDKHVPVSLNKSIKRQDNANLLRYV